MRSLTEHIPPFDKAILEVAFDELKEKLPPTTAEDFAGNIVWRIYTELCCSPEGRHVRNTDPHAGNAFKKWIDDETHYAIGEKTVDENAYARIRRSIVRSAAARAAELFGAWNGSTTPPRNSDDHRNLRASLKPE